MSGDCGACWLRNFSAAAATVVIEANEVVKIGETAKVIAEGDDLVLRGTLEFQCSKNG